MNSWATSARWNMPNAQESLHLNCRLDGKAHVVIADWAALGCLVVASGLFLFNRRGAADRKQAIQDD